MAGKRPPHLKPPAYLSKSPPVPEPGPATETEETRRPERQGADPLRRLGEQGDLLGLLSARRRLGGLDAFALERPREQAARPPRRPTPRSASRAQTAATIGMSTPSASAARLQHRRGEGAFGDGPAVGEQVGGAGALADALAEAEVARAGRRAGEDEIAEAGEAGERLGARALGEAEAGHLGEAARDQGGAGVEAEPAARRRRRRRWRARS